MATTERRARHQRSGGEHTLKQVLDQISAALAEERALGGPWFVQEADGAWRTDRPMTVAVEQLLHNSPSRAAVLQRLLDGTAPPEAFSGRPRPANPTADAFRIARQVVSWARQSATQRHRRLPRQIGRGESLRSVAPLAARPRRIGAGVSRRPLPDGRGCAYCGAPASVRDHVWPRSRGGGNEPRNIVSACDRCNAWKGNRSLLGAACPGCSQARHPGDVVTATGAAYYACRCGATWQVTWNLQAVPSMAHWLDVPRPSDIPIPPAANVA